MQNIKQYIWSLLDEQRYSDNQIQEMARAKFPHRIVGLNYLQKIQRDWSAARAAKEK